MDRGVLADLQAREVEAERRQAPAEVLDLAVRHAGQAVGDERVLDLDELQVERHRRGVAVGGRIAVHEARSRPAQPLGDEAEAPAVRLVGEAPDQLAAEIREGSRVRCQAHRQRGVTGGGAGHGQHLHQPRGHRLIAAQHVVGLDPHRAGRVLCRDGRIAVPVGADPRTQAQEGRDARGTRAAVRIKGRVGRAVELRHDAEERLVEEGHRRANLVEWLQGVRPDGRGVPQQRQLLAQ